VALRYNVNFLRERVDRQRRARARARVMTVSLLLFAVMLMVTCGAYMRRELDISIDVQSTQILLRTIAKAGLKVEDVQLLRQQNKRVQSLISQMEDQLQDSACWSSVLLSLAACCQSENVGLKKVQARTDGEGTFLLLDGACADTDPVRRVHSFTLLVADKEAFGRSKLMLISNEEGDGLTFEAQVPLRPPTLPQVHPSEG
jgi:Tfp pilus assembly protein PilN